jgi:predicted amidohydrolase YtcJ
MKKIERIILANFHTFDDAFSTAEAVAILGERIVAVGERDAILDMKSAGTVVDDLRDFTAIPGFNDAHAHMDMVGLQSVRPGLEGARSMKYLQPSRSWRGRRSRASGSLPARSGFRPAISAVPVI